MRKLLFAIAVTLVGVGSAVAEDDDTYPYRDDGPARDFYLQTGIKSCVEAPGWRRLGSAKEVKAFCECKMMHQAENMTYEDIMIYHQYTIGNRSLPPEINAKFVAANDACKKNFKLPEVPKRR